MIYLKKYIGFNIYKTSLGLMWERLVIFRIGIWEIIVLVLLTCIKVNPSRVLLELKVWWLEMGPDPTFDVQ